MRLLVTTAAALALTTAAVAADTPEIPVSNPTQIVSDITDDNLVAILTELGATKIETRDAGNGRKHIVFYDGTMPYNMTAALCDVRPGKCVAFGIVAILDTGSNNYSTDAINAVNKSNNFVTLVRIDANKIGGGRVEIVDGGVTRKNLAINIAAFIGNFIESMKVLNSQLVASYQRGGGGFQNASYGPSGLRGVPATPQEMHTMVDGLSKQFVTRLRR